MWAASHIYMDVIKYQCFLMTEQIPLKQLMVQEISILQHQKPKAVGRPAIHIIFILLP